jgi:hypothetical protein
MQSTADSRNNPTYLGADFTDRRAAKVRPIDWGIPKCRIAFAVIYIP